MNPPQREEPDRRETRAWLDWVTRENWHAMRRVALRYSYGCDPEDAQDAVQEAMVKVLAGDVDLLNGQGTPWGRLLGTIRNVARNRNRKEEVRETELFDETLPPP